MADANKKITSKVFKVLPMFEENYETYYKYLSRIIIELQGEEQTEPLKETIVALKGLKAEGTNVEHDGVRRIVMRYTSKLNET